ncbi:hypothetical protein [Synechococcus sp. UW140]|uniref:hypothetical protein n=1 Tax=Synechococcus sp. UW140 TaxID=368503 RepID=UPI0010BD96A4|nr:hypothetical protein [Synechococcus sp. UW140]
MNEHYGYKQRPPLSSRLKVEEATVRSKRVTPTRQPTGIKAGLADMGIKYQKPVKHLRKVQKDKIFVQGQEEGSIAEELFLDGLEYGDGAMSGEDRHMVSLLTDASDEDVALFEELCDEAEYQEAVQQYYYYSGEY